MKNKSNLILSRPDMYINVMWSETHINEISIRRISEVLCLDTEKRQIAVSSPILNLQEQIYWSVSILPHTLTSAYGSKFLILSYCEPTDLREWINNASVATHKI